MTAAITDDELAAEVTRLLWIFHDRRVAALEKLDLRNVLSRKNPYLFRAIGSGDAATLVEELLRARISSSDETIFGNEFFEPLAAWVAEMANRDDPTVHARTSTGAGVDVEIEYSDRFTAIAVKSGTSVFNAQSKAKQKDQFAQARSRLQKTRKQFDPVVAYSYGRLNSSDIDFRVVAGQAFWDELSGDENFYLRIVRAMAAPAAARALLFTTEYANAVTRLSAELLSDFADEHGQLDWEKLVIFNSAVATPRRAPKATVKIEATSSDDLDPE